MTNAQTAGIYLMIEFDWPASVQPDQAALAAKLHAIVQGRDWIREVVAGSGGLGAGPASLWIFWLENYAALDRLLRDEADEVGQAYRAFFREMPVVAEKLREEVVFL